MRTPGGIFGQQGLVQFFRAPAEGLSLIAPVVATYGGGRTGELTLSLYSAADIEGRVGAGFAPADLSGVEPAMTRAHDAAALVDNEPIEIHLPPGRFAPGEVVALRLHSADATSDTCVTVWLDEGESRIAGHISCFFGGRDQGGHGLVALTGPDPARRQAPAPVPEFLLYSPVNQCNLNCVHCISRETRGRPARLGAAVKEEIRRWARNGWLKGITTDYSGDILWADARFGGEIDFLIELDIPLHTDTNASHLTSSVSEKLLRSRLVSINFSLDAAEEETYRRVRRGAPPLGQVTAQIAEFVQARARAGRGDVELSMSFTLMRSTLAEWAPFIRLAARLGVPKVVARHLEAYTPDLDGESLWHDRPAFNSALAEAREIAASEGVELSSGGPLDGPPVTRGHRGFCPIPWSSAVVLGNGDVAVCCVPRTKIGSLHEQSMEEIWNGPLYRAFRASVNSDRPPPMCDACPMFRKPNNIHSYLPHRVMAGWKSPYDQSRTAGG